MKLMTGRNPYLKPLNVAGVLKLKSVYAMRKGEQE